MRDFKDLKVWQKAHPVALAVYRITATFPKHELFGLTSQIRRCAGSIGANLAEGCGRQTDGELSRFVQISMGSASELEYHLLLARDLNYLTEEQYATLQVEVTAVRKMLASLNQTIAGSLKPKIVRKPPGM